MNTTHKNPFLVSPFGWTYWFPILVTGGIVAITFFPINRGVSLLAAVGTLAGLAFFRDFPRPIPGEAGVMVSPADGTVTEITTLDHYAPFNGPALRVGIFLSVLDVHVNRSPCDGVVLWTKFEEGQFLDARHPHSGGKNQSNTLAIGPAADAPPHAVVKQIVGAIARRIICPAAPGDALARGQRFGMIAFGSRTELYVPQPAQWAVRVQKGQHVKGGSDVILAPRG